MTYAQKISKAEAEIDWQKDAAEVLRKVRAFNPAPVAQTLWGAQQLRIWEAELAPSAAGERAAPGLVTGAAPYGIDVACGSGTLRITRLQLAGRKPVTAAEILNSEQLAGARFSSP